LSEKFKNYVYEVISKSKGDKNVELILDEENEDYVYSNFTEAKSAIDRIKSELSFNMDVNILLSDKYLIPIHEIGSDHIGKLIKIRGMISSIGSIKPMYNEAIFICRKCQSQIHVLQEDPFKITSPYKCPHCRNLTKLDLNSELSKFCNSQRIVVQEFPKDSTLQIPDHKSILITKKSLLNLARCGDHVEVVGVVKIRNFLGSQTSRFTETFIEADSITVKRKDISISSFTNEQIEQFKQFTKQPNIYNTLIFNVAPSLNGLELEKEAVLLALVGGVPKAYPDINIRGNTHVLLVGDPSVGKTQLLTAASSLVSNGIFSSAKSSSIAGLTAAAIKENDGYILYAGILVLADGGVACIDEIDKMKPEDREAIHEALEKQTVTYHKADIHTQLSARTTVIAAANPQMGRYDLTKDIADNIKNLPPTILSRFDLIFIIIDKPDIERDKMLVDCVFGNRNVEYIDREFLMNYLAYAKNLKPKMTVKAEDKLENFFLKARQSQSLDNAIQITPRQLYGLIRLAEAHAKILLKEEVDEDDAERAIYIMSESLKQTCKFGSDDGNIYNIENATTLGQKLAYMLDILRKYDQLTRDEWMDECKFKISPDEFDRLIIQLINNGKIIEVSPSTYRAA